MKTNSYATGLAFTCLLLLSGCGSAPPLPAPQVIRLGCPAVVPCQLPATNPTINGELLTDADRIEAAWAECAAQVDTVYQHQVTHE